MRILQVNGQEVELSKNTVIAINFQNGDLSDVSQRKATISNSIELPFTSKNRSIFEFIENINYSGTLPYSQVVVNYYDGNIQLLNSAKGFVITKKNGYELKIISSGGVLDLLRETRLRDLLRDNFTALESTTGSGLIDLAFAKTSGYYLPYWAYYDYYYDAAQNTLLDGHFAIMLTEVFDYIETLTGYSFTKSGTVYHDSEFEELFIPFYDVVPYKFTAANWKTYLFDDPTLTGTYVSDWVIDDFDYFGGKSVMDLIKVIATMFCCVVEIDEQNKQFNLVKFNDLSDIVDWSGKLLSIKNKKFSFGKYQQNNYINYKTDSLITQDNARILFSCNNSNLEQRADFNIGAIITNKYLSIDAPHSCPLIGTIKNAVDNENIVFTSDPLKNIAIFKKRPVAWLVGNHDLGIHVESSGVATFSKEQSACVQIDFTAEYSRLEETLTNCVSYNAELNLNLLDIHSFSHFNLVKIDELGGVFYVNRITGFNSLSKTATNVELLKIQ
jgi:hypothetical protein